MDNGRSPFLLMASRIALGLGSSCRKRKIISATHVNSFSLDLIEKSFDFEITLICNCSSQTISLCVLQKTMFEV